MSGWRKRQIANLIFKKERQAKMLEILKVMGVLCLIILAYGVAGYFDERDEILREQTICEFRVDGYHPPHVIRVPCKDLKKNGI
jgi:hypothetical protein